MFTLIKSQLEEDIASLNDQKEFHYCKEKMKQRKTGNVSLFTKHIENYYQIKNE